MAKTMEAIIAIAGEISPTLGAAIDGVDKKLKGLDKNAVAVTATLTAIGTAAIAATGYLAKLGDDYAQASGSLAATTGLAGDELAELEGVLQDVYKAGYGESMADVADGISMIYRNTGLAGEELTAVSEAAYALSDTFGYDITESSRAAKAMMTNFGIGGEEAMELIAAGAQNGLDYSGELMDSISEYSVQFAKIGLDANDMFNVFQAGAESGAWNLDKVGDAVKEFSIRSIDGSKGTIEAYETLGLNAEEMMQTFAKGGEGAEAAFKQVAKALMEIEDPVARDAAGVQLFGTMWEDLGVDAMAAMANVSNAAYGTGDALGTIKEVKYDNLSAALEGIKRQLEVALLPAAQAVHDFLVQMAPTIGAVFGFVAEHAGTIIPIVAGLTGALLAYKVATVVVAAAEAVKTAVMAAGATTMSITTVATWALNAAMAVLTSPIFLVAAAIGAVIAIGVLLWRNWDTVKAKAAELGAFLSAAWSNIKAVIMSVWNSIVSFLSSVWSGIIAKATTFVNTVKTRISTAWSSLTSILTAPFRAVGSFIDAVAGKVGGLISKISGIGGKLGSIKIPFFAAGGFTSGPSIAGEAGTEAVISFDPRYRNQNLSYWAQAGRMLGAETSDFSLGGGSSSTYVDLGGVNFAPNIIVKGNAKKEDIIAAIRESSSEFMDMLDELISEREETVYA